MIKSGAYGTVFIKEDFAIKKQYWLKDDHVVSQAIKEAALLTYLNHPRIIRPLKILIAGDKLSITLPVYQRLNPLLVKNKKGVMVKLLEGLIYLHDNGIVHADIKDGNLLMDDKENPYYIDFGSGKIDECGFQKVTTFAYSAPEVSQGIHLCKEGDVWSLGLVFLMIVDNAGLWEILPEDYHSEDYYRFVTSYMDYRGIRDPLLRGMLEPEMEKRWTARECYHHLVGLECERVITPRPEIPQVEGREMILNMVKGLMEEFGIQLEEEYGALYDYYFSKFRVNVEELVDVAIGILILVIKLYESRRMDEHQILMKVSHLTTWEKVVEAMEKILIGLDFRLIVKS